MRKRKSSNREASFVEVLTEFLLFITRFAIISVQQFNFRMWIKKDAPRLTEKHFDSVKILEGT